MHCLAVRLVPGLCALLLLACGDSPGDSASAGPSCGPGTVLAGNVCVPDGTADSGGGTEVVTTASADTDTDGGTGGGTDGGTGDSADTGSGTGGETGAPATTTTDSTSAAGTTGDALACPGGPGEMDLHQAMLFDNPPGLADWPETTKLTTVDFTADGVHVEFSKLEGPERWPDIVPPGWEGPLQYTLGMAECIDGQWYASAAIQYWYGLAASGGNVAQDDQVAVNWYYDAGRWGPLAGRQPATGETIGIFVVAGNARAVHENDPLNSPVMERSNVVLVPMPGARGASHKF